MRSCPGGRSGAGEDVVSRPRVLEKYDYRFSTFFPTGDLHAITPWTTHPRWLSDFHSAGLHFQATRK